MFGNFILKLALSMYVLEATGSAAIFAGILSAATIPTILLSPLLSESNAIAVISTLLIILSILGAFETPAVQACIPAMLQGDNIMKGNAVVNQVASLSYLIAPMLGGVLYAMLGLKPVMYASVVCFFMTCFPHTAEDAKSFNRKSDGLYINGYFVCSAHRTNCVRFFV